MNQELAKVIEIYTTKTHQELSNYLIGKSKDTLIGILVDLLTIYINDKNSSTIREFITVTLAGYEHRESKIGYNGFKQDAYMPGKTIKCEAKPKNINTEEFRKYEQGKRKTKPAKLNGGGNFSDYTPQRLKKDLKEKNLNMLISGFIDGKLIYILEFPFRCADFVNHLNGQLKKWQNKLKGSKTTRGQFLRSASFDYRHYINCPELKVIYLLPKAELRKYKDFINDKFYKWMEQQTQ